MRLAAVVSGAELESADPVARHDGLLVGAGILGGALFGALVLVVLAPRPALAVVRPRPRDVGLWILAATLLVAAFDLAAWRLGRPLVEPAWADVARTAPPLLLPVALTVTSIFEELYVRGFLQSGLTETRLRAPGAIALTALLFTAAHAPHDAVRFADVLSAGVLLGVARWQSRSTIPGMIVHVIGNLKVLVFLHLGL